MKKNIWKIILVIGLLPFIFIILYGIFSSILGFSGICILNCTNEYGFVAFIDSIILYSYVYWPTYVIGFILIITSIILFKKKD